MTHRATNTKRSTVIAVSIPLVAATLLAGCSSGNSTAVTSPASGATSGSASSSATSSASASPSATASTCVKDVQSVISTALPSSALTAPLPADLVAKLTAAGAAGFAGASTPGAVVGIRTPQGTWIHTYGYADPKTKAAMTADVHQRIGSVTKTMTGTLLLQLAEKNLLSLDDPISKYIPGVPNGDQVTLRMLANMTSGVTSYTQVAAFTDVYFAHPETVFTPAQLAAIGIAQKPLFEPGTAFNYSNTNTILLGLVIEKVSGSDIATLLKDKISQPLGLTGTSWPGASPELPNPHAQGFTTQGDFATAAKPANATNWNPSWGWTAGEVISTMNDLLVYDRALGTGQGLLSPTTQAERLTSFPGAAGYGLAMGCVNGWVGHTGELPGFNTSVFYDTTSDTSVVTMTNSDIASGDCSPEFTTLEDDPRNLPCSAPATRIFVALSEALGHPFKSPKAG